MVQNVDVVRFRSEQAVSHMRAGDDVRLVHIDNIA